MRRTKQRKNKRGVSPLKRIMPVHAVKKATTFLAAAAIALSGLYLQPITQKQVYAEAQNSENEQKVMILDPITIDAPSVLADLALPESEYGTWFWADSTQKASKSSEDFTVFLKPKENTDLSWMEGWDAVSGSVKGSVTIFIKNPEDGLQDTEATVEDPDINETNDDVLNPEETAAGDAVLVSDDSETATDNENPGSPGSAESSQNPPSGELSTDTSDGSLSPESPSEEKEEKSAPVADAGNPISDTDVENSVPDADVGKSAPVADAEDSVPDTDVENPAEDTSPVSAPDDLTEEEKQQMEQENHTARGITVAGESLPWSVQLRVSDSETEAFYSIDDADIFMAYDFVLWDLQTDSEYLIPDGDYVSFRIPVKEGYDYLVEHILHNGARESIEPTLDGNILIFSTSTLSSFGIAGSQTIVGEDGIEGNYPSAGPTKTPTPVPTRSPKPTGSAQSGSSQNTAISANAGNSNSSVTKSSGADRSSGNQTDTTGKKAVQTADETPIFPWMSGLFIAILSGGFAAVLLLRRNF